MSVQIWTVHDPSGHIAYAGYGHCVTAPSLTPTGRVLYLQGMPRRDDFSDQAFGVQIRLTDEREPLIAQVHVGRRPPGLYGGRDRSHVTSWQTFVDGVRFRIVARAPVDALEAVLALAAKVADFRAHEFARLLRAEPLKAARDEDEMEQPTSSPAFWYEQSARHLDEVRAAAQGYLQGPRERGTGHEVMLLQNLIAGYLHHRNTLPLTAVPEDFPKGPALAAGKHVQQVESTIVKPGAEAVAALWTLLDADALLALAVRGTPHPFAKQIDPQEIVVAAVADHITSMEQSYPYTCRQVGFRRTVPPLVRHEGFGLWTAAVTDAHKSISPKIGQPVNTWAGLDRLDDQDDDRFAVQLDLHPDGRIRQMYVGGRPASVRGRHATAWVVLCDFVRACVVGKRLGEVQDEVKEQVRRIRLIHTRLGLTAPAAPRLCPDTLDEIQGHLVQFLLFLNGTPGAVVDTGGLSPAGSEALHRRRLREIGGIEQVGALFDAKVLDKLLQIGVEGGQLSDVATDHSDVMALRIALHAYLSATAYDAHLTAQAKAEIAAETGSAVLLSAVGVSDAAADSLNVLVWRALNRQTAYDPGRHSAELARFTAILDARNEAKAPKRLQRTDSSEYIPMDDSDS